jgi:extradiol dioxygenase family protein
MIDLNPFHLAIPVKDIKETRAFYRDILDCKEGRSSDSWVDFDFFGHQLVIHKVEHAEQKKEHNPVDGHEVPVPHFGVILDWKAFHELADRLRGQGIEFIIEPYVRFEGQVGEQSTMFFNDPSGNALEFKAFKNPEQLFAK